MNVINRLNRAAGFYREHGALELLKLVTQRLLGRFYTGLVLSWIADRISRSNLPDFLVRLCPVAVNQAWTARALAMDRLAGRVLSRQFTALEIGTWFGAGSTLIWSKHLKPGCKLMLCDTWTQYLNADDASTAPAYALMNNLYHVAINSTLKKVYDQERKTGGEIIVIRGSGSHVMEFLKPQTFDLIYIDGSHYYEDVRRDIELAKSLIKDGGCICGDDLEIRLPAPEAAALARRHIGKDFIYSTLPDGTAANFHPGVLLAVSEHFNVVNHDHGFWWVWSGNGCWSLDPPASPAAGTNSVPG